MSRPSLNPAFHNTSQFLRIAASAVLLGLLPACSTQLGPIFGGDSDGPTGSITPRDKRFSNSMNDADWGQAKAALQTSLETPIAGQAASWSNPDTGLQGTVTAVGQPFSSEGGTCNAFVATLADRQETQWFQGRACRSGSEAWKVADVSTMKAPKTK